MRLRLLAVLVMLSPLAQGELVTKTVDYEHDGKAMKGYLAYDPAMAGSRPGVLVIHEWWGLNDYARRRTEELAEMGYVAFAADMYGGGVTTKDPDEAGRLAGQVKGTPLMAERARKGLAMLRDQAGVDPARVAAIGFCFGGTAVLELAYSGADVNGVAAFHAGLTRPEPDAHEDIAASILVLHGSEDPMNPPEKVMAFRRSLDEAGADWQMVTYGGAVHSFTNPEADEVGMDGVAYDAEAARRSWKHMQLFFDELFQR